MQSTFYSDSMYLFHVCIHERLYSPMYGSIHFIHCVSIKVHSFYFCDNVSTVNEIIFDKNVAENIWNTLIHGNFDSFI